MSKTDFKKYFNCEPQEEIENKILQFPAKCGVLYKDNYMMHGYHCIYDKARVKAGNLCSVVYYFKSSWSEVAKVTYHAETVDDMMGAEVYLNNRRVGWIEKDLQAYYYCPATVFAESIMANIFEAMLSFRRKKEATENTKVILRAEERTDEQEPEEKEEVVEQLREDIANMF